MKQLFVVLNSFCFYATTYVRTFVIIFKWIRTCSSFSIIVKVQKNLRLHFYVHISNFETTNCSSSSIVLVCIIFLARKSMEQESFYSWCFYVIGEASIIKAQKNFQSYPNILCSEYVRTYQLLLLSRYVRNNFEMNNCSAFSIMYSTIKAQKNF